MKIYIFKERKSLNIKNNLKKLWPSVVRKVVLRDCRDNLRQRFLSQLVRFVERDTQEILTYVTTGALVNDLPLLLRQDLFPEEDRRVLTDLRVLGSTHQRT